MGLPANRRILTWFEGKWHEGNVPIMGSADHGTWLGTLVFDGARWFDGVTPDLDRHCARMNNSAAALGLNPPMSTEDIVALAEDGCAQFDGKTALYIRPMAWSTEGGPGVVDPDPESTRFALAIEEIAMPSEDRTATLTTTSFVRPTLASATVNAKAACLYPNNQRMLKEAQAKGYSNVIACDQIGNVAETATSNIWMVKDGVYFTPIPNGCFLNGITRQRVLKLLRDNGEKAFETVLTLNDFRAADEIFMTGNLSKVQAAVKFEDRDLDQGPKTRLARKMYFDWAYA